MRPLTFSLCFLLSAPLVPCQVSLGGPVPAPQSILTELSLEAATMQDLAPPVGLPPSFDISVVLGGQSRTLRLNAHSVRSPDFKLLVDDGIEVREIPAPATRTYRGTMLGELGSIVTAALLNGQIEATVYLAESTWGIQAANALEPALPQASHVVYRAADINSTGHCGVADVHMSAPQHTAPVPPASALLEAEIAFDVTNALYLLWGRDVARITTLLDQTLNNIDVIYTRDVDITYALTQTIIRTSPVYASNTTAVLGEMATRWRNNHQAVVRDVAHMFTGRPSSGILGVANLSAICGTTRNYGVTWFSNNTVWRAGIASHELGHNWSASHCDGVNPCWIMCSAINGCNRNITKLSPVSINSIQGYKATRGCLSVPVSGPPAITSVTPNQAPAHQATVITVTGTDLAAVTSMTLGSTTLNPGQFVIVDPNTITFTTQNPFEIATHQVTATNSAGTSNQQSLQILGSHPSVLTVPAFHVRGFALDYKFETDNGWLATMLVSTSNVPSILPGIVSLNIGSSFSDLYTVVTLVADNTGVAKVQLAVPLTLPSGLVLYFQGLTFLAPVLPIESSNAGTVTLF